jgi:hypothetical protein
MNEYELYIPLSDNSGEPASPGQVASIKSRLRERFGGFTLFPQEGEGEWQTGGHRFHDRIVILRVLTEEDADSRAWFKALKQALIIEFAQTDFLITVRQVDVI